MAKDILFDRELWEGMMAGIEKLAGAVKVTLGPKGRNVMMPQPPNLRDAAGEIDPSAPPLPHAPTFVTNDGVTIARVIRLPDPYEEMGASLLREAAIKTNDEAGDGTTTSVILAEELIREGVKNVVAGAHPLGIRRGMTKACEVAVEEIRRFSVPIQTKKEISQVAAISCQDPEIGGLVGEAFDSVGTEGVVSVDVLSKSGRTELDIQKGIVFERGYMGDFMITDKEKGTAELYNPYILLTDHKIENPNELIDIMIMAAEENRPLLIIAEGIERGAMGIIARNKLEGNLDTVGVQPPFYGEGRLWRLEDMAVQTGGRFISKDKGDSLRDVTRNDLGGADHVSVSKRQTIISGGHGDPKAVEDRINQLKYYIEHTDYEFNKNRFKERLAKFVSGVATIQAGGDTEVEIKERKLRIEDAINAARSAMEEGIVAGGGIALVDAIPAVQAFADTLEGDEKVGAKILIQAMEKPCAQIALNAGLKADGIVWEVMKRERGVGFDADRMEYVDMIGEGIVDPVKVTRLALESAVSVAATLLTANAGLTEVRPKPKKED
ncbi:MAG: molecular chaperone GroEL [Mogibacterium sp.]|nr:molecular chaperone GroEL [Mogibacterium sp.]